MNKNKRTSSLIIPFKELGTEALQGVIEEFVTKDGTDYGEPGYKSPSDNKSATCRECV
ncbi:MAG: YheU family protein [Thermodesulfobacteriota bacterium]|nr:YheU family protein [Thermodesulfobacteriota bacterium]